MTAMMRHSMFANRGRDTEERHEAQELGAWGEKVATHYLESLGYAILELNYRSKNHEADIIAMDEGELVVVEVKTRSESLFGSPEEAVDLRKRRALISVANQYVLSHGRTENVRFDIVAVMSDTDESDVRHIKNAFGVIGI